MKSKGHILLGRILFSLIDNHIKNIVIERMNIYRNFKCIYLYCSNNWNFYNYYCIILYYNKGISRYIQRIKE